MALPSCPRLYTELAELILDPEATAADAAALVERDVAMSAKVLQLVNSAFFGVGRSIARTSEAVHYLGLETVRALVLHAGAFEAFAPARPIDGFDLGALQHASQLAARVARRLTTGGRSREHAFTAGLLHGVGLLVLARQDPYELGEAIAEARGGGRALHEVEYARHGSSHAELGAYVLGLWGLPEPIVEAVAHQHRVGRLAPAPEGPALAVHVATALCGEISPAVAGTAAPSLDHAALDGPASRIACRSGARRPAPRPGLPDRPRARASALGTRDQRHPCAIDDRGLAVRRAVADRTQVASARWRRSPRRCERGPPGLPGASLIIRSG